MAESEESKVRTGCFRQQETVLYVSECGERLVESSNTPAPSAALIRRVLIVGRDQTLTEFTVIADNHSDRRPRLFLCVLCRQTFTQSEVFCRHSESLHSIQPKEINQMNGDAIALMADQSLAALAASRRDPDSQPLSVFDKFSADSSRPPPFPLHSAFPLSHFPKNGGDLFSPMFSPMGQILAQRNSAKTLKCPKCNWHYKYQETLEIHMKEKHSDGEVNCLFCVHNRAHPKLARGETYSCGYKPYRCELCKYSTTTKGNLSIHMQSDKHLHAVQEMPNHLVSPSSAPTPSDWTSEPHFQCLICGNFASDSVAELIAHLEVDRSRAGNGDVALLNGFYHCHLCPYNTNLKANFQLHTRTDKHLQRVQLINHMREGNAQLAPGAAICRLATVKSLVQVRCRPCQDVLTCATSIREHCESRLHLSRILYLGMGPQQRSAMGRGVESQTLFECRRCSFVATNSADARSHIPLCSSSSSSRPSSPNAADADSRSDETPNDAAVAEPMTESAFYCRQCDFLSPTLEALRDHERNGDHNRRTSDEVAESPLSCPLCVRPVAALRTHLLEEHNIVDEVADRLMSSAAAAAAAATGAEKEPSAYRHRCLCCPLVFKHEDQLRAHDLTHSFRLSQKCAQCSQTFQSVAHLLEHQRDSHPVEEHRCALCSLNFPSAAALQQHTNSIEHLHRAKQYLEEQSPNQLQLSDKVMQLLQRRSPPLDRRSPTESPQDKLYKCNVCCQKYSQGSTLDIHLRSVAHQSRMNRLNELVRSGEVDSTKPVSEQPGGIPQKIISELIDSPAEKMTGGDNPLAFMNMFNIQQFMQMSQQSPSTSAPSAPNGEKSKMGAELRRSLEGYGFDLVSQFVDKLDKDKIELIPEDKCAELRQQFTQITRDTTAPVDAVQSFAENLRKAVEAIPNKRKGSADEEETSPPDPKRHKTEENTSGEEFGQQLMMQMMGLPTSGLVSPEVLHAAFASMMPSGLPSAPSPSASSPQKRARTRITDDQLKVLRQYFDINNSPTENQVKEMSQKAQLPEKVIKHWFRNTLFKERQRDKNSPYNFNVPVTLKLDLDTYEKTGEAKIIPIKPEETEPQNDEISAAVELAEDHRSPSNSSTHSSTATIPTNPPQLNADLMANFGKAALQAMAMFNGNGADFAANPFAALLNSAVGNPSAQSEENAFAQILNGMSAGSRSSSAAPSIPRSNGIAATPNNQSPAATATTGRRANRTRFTDFQLRTLQEFFDRQAYPKDDDLEMLSKKLSLSPRVIVVWFQNARQKARKIYENQPNSDQNERFIRTPGCNFQCKRCQLVFQRYYELIQHQQRVCYVNDGDAQQTDNRSLEANIDDEQRQTAATATVSAETKDGDNNNTDFLQFLSKSNGDALLKMFANSSKENFAKRCPFCGSLFHSRDKMVEHMSTKHSDSLLGIDVDSLPDANESPALSTTEELLGKISALTNGSVPLDLSVDGGMGGDRGDSTSPTLSTDEGDDFAQTPTGFDFRSLGDSPLLSAFGAAPLGPLNAVLQSPIHRSSNASAPPANSTPQAGSKRYRTHLTPLQVFIMKSLFTDYKTPSMTECEVLGHEIGLHKRVVQVWFQNARAKQRKCGAGSISEEGLCSTSPGGCEMCGVEFNGRTSIQDHIFTVQHINQVKERGATLRGTSGGDDVSEGRSRSANRALSTEADATSSEDMQFSPFNLVYSTLLDPNVVGTPIAMLQIPETVMTQISADLRDGQTSTKFTQDGMEMSELATKLNSEDFQNVKLTESEVGWACAQCTNVFQQEAFLRNHQKFICTGADGVFRLIQRHYECSLCSVKFGTQEELRSHCEQSSHKSKRAPIAASSSPQSLFA